MLSQFKTRLSGLILGNTSSMSTSAITVHRHADKPTKAWSELQIKQVCDKVSNSSKLDLSISRIYTCLNFVVEKVE